MHLENPPVTVGPRNYRCPLSLLLIGFPPRAQPFASRKPTCAGPTQILLFYHFTILLILREIGSLHLENPPVPVGPRNCPFPDFARNPEKIPPSLFTFNRISSTGSTVCISKTHPCRSDPDFTILLFYYFTILLFYYFTILLFYKFYGKSGVCISKTHLCRLDPEITALLISREIQRKFLPVSLLLIGFPPRAQQFASRKPTCAGPTQILLFYYFTNFTRTREFASRKPTCAGWTQNLPLY